MLALILPPLLVPVFTGSLIPITCPGLTITPDDKSIVKVTVSVKFCSLNLTHRANREACPDEVTPNASICFSIIPYLDIAASEEISAFIGSCT